MWRRPWAACSWPIPKTLPLARPISFSLSLRQQLQLPLLLLALESRPHLGLGSTGLLVVGLTADLREGSEGIERLLVATGLGVGLRHPLVQGL